MNGKHQIVNTSYSNIHAGNPRMFFHPPSAYNAPLGQSSRMLPIFNHNIVDDGRELSDCDLGEEDLLARIRKDFIRIKRLKNNRHSTRYQTSQRTAMSDEAVRRKNFSRAQDQILRAMRTTVTACKVRGFVFGIISEQGKAVTAVSENLREWWKGEVRFDRNGVAAADNYDTELAASLEGCDQTSDVDIFRTLMQMHDETLGSILSALFHHCSPSQRRYPLEKGVPPPWWPTGTEDWCAQYGIPADIGQPPYRKPHDLRKGYKVVVLVAVIRHMSGGIEELHDHVRRSKCLQERMAAYECTLWSKVLGQEGKNRRKLQSGVVGDSIGNADNNIGNADNSIGMSGYDVQDWTHDEETDPVGDSSVSSAPKSSALATDQTSLQIPIDDQQHIGELYSQYSFNQPAATIDMPIENERSNYVPELCMTKNVYDLEHGSFSNEVHGGASFDFQNQLGAGEAFNLSALEYADPTIGMDEWERFFASRT